MGRFIIAILGFSVSLAVFFLYTKPTYDSVKVLLAENAQYDQALERAAQLQSLKQTLLSRYNAFNPADIDRLHRLLPDHVDNVRLVLDFDNLARKHSLAIQNVVVGREIAESTTVGKPASADIIGGNSKSYDSLTLKFSTQGTYAGFVTFMQDLQSSLRIVDLSSLTLTPIGDKQAIEPLYRYDVTIRTYWLK